MTGKIKIGASLTKHIHFAIGAQGMFAFSTFDSEVLNLGLVYGALSVGTKDNYLNAGIGRGNDNLSSGATTAYTFGGSLRIGDYWRFHFEYMKFRQDNTNSFSDYTEISNMGTLGMSWFKRQHQIDFGLHANQCFMM